jgi:hypothetical protein
VAAGLQQSYQRQQWHSTSGAATMLVKAEAKALAPAKAEVLANLAAPAKRQQHSVSNSKVGSGSNSGSASEVGRNGKVQAKVAVPAKL